MRGGHLTERYPNSLAAVVICTLSLLWLGLCLSLLAGNQTAWAVTQDDDRGYWTDTFTNTAGISSIVSMTVETVPGQLVLDAAPVYVQSDWSGGPGLMTTTMTTDQYLTGAGLDVTEEGELRLGYTLRAGDSQADLNGDGYLDLVFSSYYAGIDGSGTYETDSYIYYGSADGYTTTNRLGLPTTAAQGNAVADLNNDGYLDVLFCEYSPYPSGPTTDSHIYWGSAGGYSTANRTALAVQRATGCAAADLNDDGYLDLVLANFMSMDVPPLFTTDSYIYWGSAGGYSEASRTALPTVGVMSVYVADLDADGYLDLVFSNYRTNGSTYSAGTYHVSSYVYWGSATGYSTGDRTSLPTIGAHGSSVADLNDDGYLDIVFSNRHAANGTAFVYALDSYIYWGSATGFSIGSRTLLPTSSAYGNSLADLNEDGYWDIIFSNHQSDPSTHAIDSYIYWGSAAGYSTSSRTGLPTLGAAGATVGDLDHDGYLDITFANRRNGAQHDVDSYIYWGSAAGYSTSDRSQLPTHGALGSSAVGSPILPANTSFGNIYAIPITGGTTLDDSMISPAIYPASGELDSSVLDGGTTHRWVRAVWHASVPTGTDVDIAVAGSADGREWSTWQLLGTGSISGTNEALLSLAPSRYLRYRVTLTGSVDHRLTPALYDLAFWGDYAASGSAVSVPITPAVLAAWDVVTWTVQASAGQVISLQVLDQTGTLLPEAALPGNSRGLSASPIDLSTLDPAIYPSLRLQAALSTGTTSSSPALTGWTASWLAIATDIVIQPVSSTISVGQMQTYTMMAYDAFGRDADISPRASYAIETEAGGSWSGNVYTSERSGTWEVTGTFQSLVATATLRILPPTGVELVRFDVVPHLASLLLEWETASEVNTVGYNLYRAEALGGPTIRLNDALIPCQAPGSPVGAAYAYLDSTVTAGTFYYYWLEDVDVHGVGMWHGPTGATAGPYRIYLPVTNR